MPLPLTAFRAVQYCMNRYESIIVFSNGFLFHLAHPLLSFDVRLTCLHQRQDEIKELFVKCCMVMKRRRLVLPSRNITIKLSLKAIEQMMIRHRKNFRW